MGLVSHFLFRYAPIDNDIVSLNLEASSKNNTSPAFNDQSRDRPKPFKYSEPKFGGGGNYKVFHLFNLGIRISSSVHDAYWCHVRIRGVPFSIDLISVIYNKDFHK